MSDNLWAPWRMEYIRAIDKPPTDGSFLADYWKHPELDRDNLVIHRTKLSFIVLNRYPYTNGHLLVAPGECVADLPQLTPQHRIDLMETVIIAERLLHAAMNPQGVNIGINIGRCAGAGLPSHLHVHIVPRWAGDTNFMTVVAHVRIAPQALQEVRDELLAALPKVLNG